MAGEPTGGGEPGGVNIKNLEPGVVARLAEQAAAEGMSQQEWLRQTLRRTAALVTENPELVSTRVPVLHC